MRYRRRKRRKFKLISISFTAMIVFVNMLAVGYAYWDSNINIQGTVTTGNINPVFNDCSILDESDAQGDSYVDVNGTVRGDEKSGVDGIMNIKICDACPGYFTSIGYEVKNTGTVPVECEMYGNCDLPVKIEFTPIKRVGVQESQNGVINITVGEVKDKKDYKVSFDLQFHQGSWNKKLKVYCEIKAANKPDKDSQTADVKSIVVSDNSEIDSTDTSAETAADSPVEISSNVTDSTINNDNNASGELTASDPVVVSSNIQDDNTAGEIASSSSAEISSNIQGDIINRDNDTSEELTVCSSAETDSGIPMGIASGVNTSEEITSSSSAGISSDGQESIASDNNNIDDAQTGTIQESSTHSKDNGSSSAGKGIHKDRGHTEVKDNFKDTNRSSGKSKRHK